MALVAGNLEQRVAEILTRYSMLEPGARVGVGVSGGADSVVLLHLLTRLRFVPVVLHINHQLRGAESDQDESFVRDLAGRLGVACEVTHSSMGAGNVEQETREARRRFFFDAMERLDFQRVALGHSRSDQAETVLYRFVRGSGLAGLAGMQPVTKQGLIRPLLTTSRAEIRTWAQDQGITWREDASNDNDTYARNWLRRKTIPELSERFNPRLEQVLADNAVAAQAEEDWWDVRIEDIYLKLLKTSGLGCLLDVKSVAGLHLAEQRRLLRRAVKDVKGDLRSVDFQHIEAVRKMMGSDAGHDRILIPGIDALRSFGTLLLSKPGILGDIPRHYQMKVELGQEVTLPFDLGSIYVSRVKTEGADCANFGVETEEDLEVTDLDGDTILRESSPQFLRVRNWEPGDEMATRPDRSPEKLKSLFQEFRIPLWERRNWPVVVAGEEIVWARRFGGSAKFKAGDESRIVFRLSCRAVQG